MACGTGDNIHSCGVHQHYKQPNKTQHFVIVHVIVAKECVRGDGFSYG